MPYLQLFVPQGKSESEAQALLEYLRDNFPLKQSEGRVLRVAANYILFEQSEHHGLTLEQEVWLEKHGGENFVRVEQSFYANDICDQCNSPIDESPTGFCPRCYATNPYVITHLILHFQPDEYPYVMLLYRNIWGTGMESPGLRIYAQAFLYLLEHGQLPVEEISETSFERFKVGARAYAEQVRTTCYFCGKLKEQCTCNYIPSSHVDMKVREEHVPISKEEYRRLQAFAEQRGMDVETFALCGLTMSEVQLVAASREAALGRILYC